MDSWDFHCTEYYIRIKQEIVGNLELLDCNMWQADYGTYLLSLFIRPHAQVLDIPVSCCNHLRFIPIRKHCLTSMAFVTIVPKMKVIRYKQETTFTFSKNRYMGLCGKWEIVLCLSFLFHVKFPAHLQSRCF